MNKFRIQNSRHASLNARPTRTVASSIQSGKRYTLNAGLTLVEIVVSIAVMALLTAVLFSGLGSSKNSQALSTGAEIILAALSEARGKTLSSEGGQSHGLYLDGDRVIIFPGVVFSEPNPLNREFILESAIFISTTSLAVSTSTLLFARVTGETANHGTITISLKSDAGINRIISVSKTGVASRQ